MLAERLNPLESPYNDVGKEIWRKLKPTLRGSYDVFFDLLNSANWQSPKELALKWFSMYCPNEWQALADNSAESLKIRREKETVRKQCIHEFGMVLINLGENPLFHQKITTRLLVKRTLARELAPNDQDRILSVEMMTNYRRWREFLSTMAQNDIITSDRGMPMAPYFHLDEEGNESCLVTIDGHIGPIESLPDTQIHHDEVTAGTILSPTIMLIARREISKILLESDVMRRHGGIMNMTDKEGTIRLSVFESLGGVPVYKKRGFGNKMSGPNFKGEFQANPI